MTTIMTVNQIENDIKKISLFPPLAIEPIKACCIAKNKVIPIPVKTITVLTENEFIHSLKPFNYSTSF